MKNRIAETIGSVTGVIAGAATGAIRVVRLALL